MKLDLKVQQWRSQSDAMTASLYRLPEVMERGIRSQQRHRIWHDVEASHRTRDTAEAKLRGEETILQQWSLSWL